jgi:hypothetical protein
MLLQPATGRIALRAVTAFTLDAMLCPISKVAYGWGCPVKFVELVMGPQVIVITCLIRRANYASVIAKYR